MPLEFIIKKPRGTGKAPTLVIEPPPSPNTIVNLTSANLTISNTQLALEVKTGTTLLAHIAINKIVTWELNGQSITLLTVDEIPFQLVFITAAEALLAVATIQTAVNL